MKTVHLILLKTVQCQLKKSHKFFNHFHWDNNEDWDGDEDGNEENDTVTKTFAAEPKHQHQYFSISTLLSASASVFQHRYSVFQHRYSVS